MSGIHMSSGMPSLCLDDIVKKIQEFVADINFKNFNLFVGFIVVLVVFIIIVYKTNFSIAPVLLQENLMNGASSSQPLPVCVANASEVKDVLNEQGETGVYQYGRAIIPSHVREFLNRMFEEKVRPMLKDPSCTLNNPTNNSQLELLDWLFVRIVPQQNGSVSYHTEGMLANGTDHTSHNFFWRFSITPQQQYILHDLRPMSETDSRLPVISNTTVKKTPADELRKTYIPPSIYDKNAYVSFTPDFNHPNLHNLSGEARDLFSRTKRVMGRSI